MIFLKFATEIKGEVAEAGHEGWINLDSIQMGVGRSITTAGGGGDRETSNPSFSEVTCTRQTDKASPELFMQAIAGKTLGLATVHFVQVGGVDKKQTYLTFELDEAMISSYSTSSGGDKPSESFSINFVKITMQYDSFVKGGTVSKGTPQKWDMIKGAKY